MKATVKLIDEEYEELEFINDEPKYVTKIGKTTYAILDGENVGPVVNVRGNPKKEGDDIEVMFFNVCPECHDESIDGNCSCFYENYKPVKVVKEVCKCCGRPY